MRLLPPTVCALALVAACGGRHDAPAPGAPAASTPPADVTLGFDVNVDVAAGEETYVCVVYVLGALASAPLAGISWEPPTGALAVHHISLYALGNAPPPGPIDCSSRDWGLGPRFAIYTLGQSVLELPAGIALRLPDGTQRIGAEVHVLRTAAGGDPPGKVVLHPAAAPPEHLAVWMEANVHVPDLPPHAVTSSTRRCAVGGDVHVVGAWPHMHKMGKLFDSTLVRAKGDASAFVHVEPWDFAHQVVYPKDVVLSAGDAIDLTCTWDNTSDQTIHDGLYTSNEMCSFAFIAWPPESSRCVE